MDLRNIPVRVIGPGSQPAEEDGQVLTYIDMPSEMWTYRPPEIALPGGAVDRSGARDALSWLRRALADYAADAEPRLANLSALDADNRELVNQVLGEGEVSIRYTGAVRARTQEAVLAGVWRTHYLDEDGQTLFDLLEVADVAHVVRMPDGRRRSIDAPPEDVPADVMNALPILVELEAKSAEHEATGRGHAINLTLLPLTDGDLEFLDARLGRGPVDTLSRAYGKCQAISTQTPNVWWVRYYSSMGTLILNTLEVVDVPAVICAAPEDLRDSATRLDAILEPYWPDIA